MRVFSPRGRLHSVVLAGLASLALSVAATWPVALAPSRLLVGHPGNDVWNHAWGYWWVARSLDAGRLPLHTDLLAFPRGGTLWFIDTVQAVLAWPVEVLFGPAVAYNLAMVLGIGLAAFGAWLLAAHATGDRAAAVGAMGIYGLSPHLLGQAYDGISETVCAGWLPLTVWAVLRLLDRPSWGRGVVLGVLGGLSALTSWYYGLFAALATVVLVGWRTFRHPWLEERGRVLGRLAAAALVAVILTLPVLLLFRASLNAPDALVTRERTFVTASLLRHNFTDVVAFFRPSKTPSPDLHALFGEELVIVIYLGWVGIALATAAWVATRRRRELAPWVLIAAVFFILSLGPYLYVGGAPLRVAGKRIALPFLALYEAIPLLDRISHPFRFVVGVELAVAVLATHGLRHLLRRRSAAVRLAAAMGVVGLVAAETALASPATLPVPCSDARVPRAVQRIAEAPGAVLDLPLTVPNLERAVYLWYQVAHGRAEPWSLNQPMPEALLANALTATLIRVEATRARTLPAVLPALDLAVGARTLARLGYGWIAVHERLYPPFKLAQVRAVLDGLFGPPWREDGVALYRLPALLKAGEGTAMASER